MAQEFPNFEPCHGHINWETFGTEDSSPSDTLSDGWYGSYSCGETVLKDLIIAEGESLQE